MASENFCLSLPSHGNPLFEQKCDGSAQEDCMGARALRKLFLMLCLVGLTTWAYAQSFRVQCPTSTITHPSSLTVANREVPYGGPTLTGVRAGGYLVPLNFVNGSIKCQQISGG